MDQKSRGRVLNSSSTPQIFGDKVVIEDTPNHPHEKSSMFGACLHKTSFSVVISANYLSITKEFVLYSSTLHPLLRWR
jgi:hypothetical protein